MKKSSPHLTTSQITKIALMMLFARGCSVWRQNNLAAVGRKFTGMYGVPDIIGFHKKTGVFVGCEIKAKRDRLSEHQKHFLGSLLKAGGLALLAVEDVRGNVILRDYAEELKNPEY